MSRLLYARRPCQAGSLPRLSSSLSWLSWVSWLCLWCFCGLILPAVQAQIPAYALYTLPSFEMNMITYKDSNLRASIQRYESDNENMVLLSQTNGRDSGLSYPLRSASNLFFFQAFRSRILTWESELNAGTATGDVFNEQNWFTMYAHLVGLELSVSLYYLPKEQRALGEEDVALRALVQGSLAFEEPERSEFKPTNEQVLRIFQPMLEDILSNEVDAFLRQLQQTSALYLQSISNFEMRLRSSSGRGSSSTETSSTAWAERVQKILVVVLMTILIVAALFGCVALRQYSRKWKQKRLEWSMEYDDPEDIDDSFDIPVGTMDDVRHGSDILHHSSARSILESTDKYLQQHRPDLIDGNGTSSHKAQNYNAMPANPFEFLFQAFGGGMPNYNNNNNKGSQSVFRTSPQGAFTPRTAHTSLQERQVHNLAAMSAYHDDEEEDEPGLIRPRSFRDEYQDELEDDGRDPAIPSYVPAYRPITTIWRNIASNFFESSPQQPHPHSSQDGIILQHAPPDMNHDLELQTIHFEENVPEEYDFAFKDFPRHDGTPCLIFNDDGTMLTPTQRQVFEIGNMNDEEEEVDEPQRQQQAVLLSDQDFQRMLAQQGRSSPRSPENSHAAADSVILWDEDDDDNLSEEESRSQFKEKLSRLYQQKHRQYEKKAIVEKHQEKRALERRKEREQERREKHKVMERNIDDLEQSSISGVIGGASARWQSSPNPYRYSPKPSFSPYRSSNGNGNGVTAASPYRNNGPSSRNNGDDSHSIHSNPHLHLQPTSDLFDGNNNGGGGFTMRPRTMIHPGGSGVPSSDLYMDHRDEMDRSTLDKLSMPPMNAAANHNYSIGRKNNSSSMSAIANRIANSNTTGSLPNEKKKQSPNSILQNDFFMAPNSISRGHGRKNSIGGNSNVASLTSAPGRPSLSSKVMHRRVNSFDHKTIARGGAGGLHHQDSGGSSSSIASSGSQHFERPVPQPRRQPRGTSRSTPQRGRTLTPTRTPVFRASTPTRTSSTLRGMPSLGRPMTPLTAQNALQHQQHQEDPNQRMTNARGPPHHRSSSSGSQGRHVRSMSSTDAEVFTHGIAGVAQRRFF